MPKNDQQNPIELANELEEKYKDDLKKLRSLSVEKIVEIGEEVGKNLKNLGISTTQIRKFLEAIRKIQTQTKFNPDQVILLRPKLAYMVGRNPRLKPLKILDPAIISASKDPFSFQKLVYFIESIIAYHRFYGGKD